MTPDALRHLNEAKRLIDLVINDTDTAERGIPDSIDAFSDDEIDLPYYLVHFQELLDGVRTEEPHKGWIDIPVWRKHANNVPGNARIMESILSLAWFYTADRPWNPYFQHPDVQERLELALKYWTGLQNPDGTFPHKNEGPVWTMSTTCFATKFMGETLRLLPGKFGPGLYGRVHMAQRKAILAVLYNDQYFKYGKRWANQYTNIFAGALAYLAIFEDEDMESVFRDRFHQAEAFQSPLGYFYEEGGPDWVYDIETHHSNHRMIWHYVRGTDLEDVYAERVRKWYKWLAANAVIEEAGLTMNCGIETRQHFPFYRETRATMYGETSIPMAEVIEEARPFCESGEERDVRIHRLRKGFTWPEGPLDLASQNTFSPYSFLHRSHYSWYPTIHQSMEAAQTLPYIKSTDYTRKVSDDRLTMIYVRRPAYYAVFSFGETVVDKQRLGLGLMWNPDAGAVLQSHSEYPWGTVVDGKVFEATFDAYIDGSTVWYSGIDSKVVRFDDFSIEVRIDHHPNVVEQIPLLLNPGHQLTFDNGVVKMPGLSIETTADVSVTDTTHRAGKKRLVMLKLFANGSLTYRLIPQPV